MTLHRRAGLSLLLIFVGLTAMAWWPVLKSIHHVIFYTGSWLDTDSLVGIGAAKYFAENHFPFWSDIHSGGQTFIGNSSNLPFYPSNLLFFVLDNPVLAFNLNLVLHTGLVLLGIYLFAKKFNHRFLLFLGFVFISSTLFRYYLQEGAVAAVLFVTPWVLFSLYLIARIDEDKERIGLNALLLMNALVMMAVSCNGEALFYLVVPFGIIFFQLPSLKSKGVVLVAVLAAVLVSAPAWTNTLSYLAQTTRDAVGYPAIQNFLWADVLPERGFAIGFQISLLIGLILMGIERKRNAVFSTSVTGGAFVLWACSRISIPFLKHPFVALYFSFLFFIVGLISSRFEDFRLKKSFAWVVAIIIALSGFGLANHHLNTEPFFTENAKIPPNTKLAGVLALNWKFKQILDNNIPYRRHWDFLFDRSEKVEQSFSHPTSSGRIGENFYAPEMVLDADSAQNQVYHLRATFAHGWDWKIYREWTFENSPSELKAKILKKTDLELDTQALLEKDFYFQVPPYRSEIKDENIEIEKKDSDCYHVRGELASARVILFNNNYDPKWKVTDHFARVFPADLKFLGVMVPPGPFDFEIRYQPVLGYFSFILALFTVNLLGALIIFKKRNT